MTGKTMKAVRCEQGPTDVPEGSPDFRIVVDTARNGIVITGVVAAPVDIHVVINSGIHIGDGASCRVGDPIFLNDIVIVWRFAPLVAVLGNI